MEISLNYEAAVYAAWITGLAIIMGAKKIFNLEWQPAGLNAGQPTKGNIFWLMIVVAGLIAISALFTYINTPLKTLIPNAELRFIIKILLVYSPVFIYLYVQKQGLATCYISAGNIAAKTAFGLLAAFAAGVVFIKIRSGQSSIPAYLEKVFSYTPASLFQTFMEGLGVGFILFRLFNWMKPVYAASLIAGVFMLSHIPAYTKSFHHSWPDALLLIAAHAGISVFIFFCLQGIKDVIALFFVHWFINAASSYTSV
jgi:hypothetical protein